MFWFFVCFLLLEEATLLRSTEYQLGNRSSSFEPFVYQLCATSHLVSLSSFPHPHSGELIPYIIIGRIKVKLNAYRATHMWGMVIVILLQIIAFSFEFQFFGRCEEMLQASKYFSNFQGQGTSQGTFLLSVVCLTCGLSLPGLNPPSMT